MSFWIFLSFSLSLSPLLSLPSSDQILLCSSDGLVPDLLCERGWPRTQDHTVSISWVLGLWECIPVPCSCYSASLPPLSDYNHQSRPMDFPLTLFLFSFFSFSHFDDPLWLADASISNLQSDIEMSIKYDQYLLCTKWQAVVSEGVIYHYFVQHYHIFKMYTSAAKRACVRTESSPSEKHYNSSRKAICKDRWGL